MNSRILTGALVAGAVAVASIFAAAPASAATLPPGQKITVIDSTTDVFYNVNPVNALGTPTSIPDSLIFEFVAGVDVDDTGHGYAIANPEQGADLVEVEAEKAGADAEALLVWSSAIYKADANAGTLSDGKPIVIDLVGDDDPYADYCSAIDYSKGVIVAVCYPHEDSTMIGTIDATSSPDVAYFTPLTVIEYDDNGEGEDIPNPFIHAIAQNPLDGKLYGFSIGFTGVVWLITLDGEAPTALDTLDWFVMGADFDRSGQLWLSAFPQTIPTAFESYLSLATFDLATNTVVAPQSFQSDDPYEIQQPLSITVWGVLAATGAVATPTVPVIAAGILLLGALLAAGTAVLRRRATTV